MDGVILVAALPRHYSFVAKRELREQFVPRVYLERLGAEFVERFAARQSAEDANRLAAAAARGRSLGFFPEGTFTRVPGLRPGQGAGPIVRPWARSREISPPAVSAGTDGRDTPATRSTPAVQTLQVLKRWNSSRDA